MEFPGTAGLGERGKPDLWMTLTDKPLRADAHRFPHRPARVDAFHAAALAAGGTDNGPPGVRTDYHPHYYAAYVIDPEGNNVEVVCHDPPAAPQAAARARGGRAGPPRRCASRRASRPARRAKVNRTKKRR